MLKIKNNFDLESTITCGQIFRYKKTEEGYIVILKDRVISLKIDNDYILIESNKEQNLKEVIYEYFDLNRDYLQIESKLIEKDINLKDAVIFSRGLKMIKQDPFETIISYIISQNNRVPSIANSLNMLSQKYGEKVLFKDEEYYLFPKIDDFFDLSMDDYRQCKVGFRDKYIYDMIKNMRENNLDLNIINEMSGDEALNYLIQFKGIGNKVASCILLFAYQKFDVFPIDTWVKKFMKEDYNIEGEKNIKQFAIKTYGDYSAIAIQYMFNYKRNKKQ